MYPRDSNGGGAAPFGLCPVLSRERPATDSPSDSLLSPGAAWPRTPVLVRALGLTTRWAPTTTRCGEIAHHRPPPAVACGRRYAGVVVDSLSFFRRAEWG